ncbi:MAG TPA: PEP-CTERM sorting domain-containing protein, partial [Isosphaeraceae bacterium]
FPTAFYTNTVTLTETGPEIGPNGFVDYTPTANQPGFVPGFNVTYNFISDPTPVPEPASLGLLALGAVGVGLAARKRSRRRTAVAITGDATT